MTNREIGTNGEELARQFLVDHGFQILERNYAKPWGEVDIIAKKDGSIRFVEVKTLLVSGSGKGGFRPEEKVNAGKVHRIHRAAQSYLEESDLDLDWQIDVVAVLVHRESGEAEFELIEHAFFD